MTDDTPAQPEVGRAELRGRVVAYMAVLMEQGTEGTRLRSMVTAEFPTIPKTTIYRWMQHALATGQAGPRLADRRISGAAAPEVGSIAALPIFASYMKSLVALESVLAYAQGEDPAKPRNPRLAMDAATRVIRAIREGVGLHATLMTAQRTEQFHEALIREIAKESPDLAQRVTLRLRALTSQLEV